MSGGPAVNQDAQRADLLEVLADLGSVTARLRSALPTIVTVAGLDEGWPDTLLTDTIRDLADSIGQLEAAAGLLETTTGAG